MTGSSRPRVLRTDLAGATEPALLSHATRYAEVVGLDDWRVVDVDGEFDPTPCWGEIVSYYDDQIMAYNSTYRGREASTRGQTRYVNDALLHGFDNYDLFGRIPHHQPGLDRSECGSETLVSSCLAAMDSMGVQVRVLFPRTLANLGRSPLPAGESQVARAFNRWCSERVCASEPRLRFFALLPLRRPAVCARIIDESAEAPGVIGFCVTSLRYQAVQDKQHARIFAQLQETGRPVVFRSGPSWEEPWMRTMDRLVSVEAVSTPHPNLVHLTNWVIGGMPERFPDLKVVWLAGGLAWVPYLMQRLDAALLKRTSEAPLLTRLPSEYIKEMYFGTQPLEDTHRDLLKGTLEVLRVETQLLYASGWPRWDFDPPRTILDLELLDEQTKRNILGETALKLFGL